MIRKLFVTLRNLHCNGSNSFPLRPEGSPPEAPSARSTLPTLRLSPSTLIVVIVVRLLTNLLLDFILDFILFPLLHCSSTAGTTLL